MRTYEVECQTLALFKDGHIGNIDQGFKVFYINCEIKDIEELINNHLFNKKLVCHINKINNLSGEVICKSCSDLSECAKYPVGFDVELVDG